MNNYEYEKDFPKLAELFTDENLDEALKELPGDFTVTEIPLIVRKEMRDKANAFQGKLAVAESDAILAEHLAKPLLQLFKQTIVTFRAIFQNAIEHMEDAVAKKDSQETRQEGQEGA